MEQGDQMYTKELDGSIQKWYVWAWYDTRFAVTTIRNAGRSAYKRYYHMDDIGKTIFCTRKEANRCKQSLITEK